MAALALGLSLAAASGVDAKAATPPLTHVGAPAVALPGSTSLGAAPAATPVPLDVVLRPRDPPGLAAFVQAVSEPSSPLYRHYLGGPAAFAARFGPSPQTIAAVERQLRRRGLDVSAVTPDGLVIHASTTAGTAERALHVGLERVRAPSGAVALLNTGAPQLPSSVAGAVTSIVGLDTQPHERAQPATAPQGQPAAAVAPCPAASAAAARQTGYTADQIAQAYDLGPLYAAGDRGAGVTVALFELASFDSTDIAAYQSCYGTNAAVGVVPVDGGASASAAGTSEVELDIEGVAGIAPQAGVAVYEGPNTSKGTIDTYQRIATDDTAKVVSTSWGTCDPDLESGQASAEATVFAEMAAQGQSVLAAAGDEGSEDCSAEPHASTALATDDPASQPDVTGVGGTRLSALGASPASRPSETVWNVVQGGGAGGGGISSNWSMPSYQATDGTAGVIGSFTSGAPCHASGGFCREVPDVSAAADPQNGYVIYYTGSETGSSGWQVVGGTSAGAPLWAALIALTDAAPGCALRPVGFLNPALYRLAATTGYGGARDFNDVTAGNNDYLGTHGGAYPATAGYDMASGLGTPIGAVLAHDLCNAPSGPTITSADSAGLSVGAPGTFTVTTSGTPVSTLTESGALPAGVAFVDRHDGTATISGASAAGGAYPLTITAANGVATASQSFVLDVGPPPPTAAFTAAPPVPRPGTAVNFDATGSSDPNPGGAITDYVWSFGDGTTATGATPTHVYAAAGTYAVTLTVTSSEGASASSVQQIDVVGPPSAAFTATQAPASLGVRFTDQSVPAATQTIVARAWSFGDGAAASTPSPTHVYAAPGPYTVMLTVTDGDGQTSVSSRTVTVAALPSPAFASSQATGTLSVDFVDASTPVSGDRLTGWTWSFGDGTGSPTRSPTHAYASAGTYTVALTVADSDGEASTTSHAVVVSGLPSAAFAAVQSPLSLSVAFSDNAAAAAGQSLTAWSWSFGDGATSSAASPSHTYSAPGSYSVMLTVTQADGATASASRTIAVSALPTTSVTPPPPKTPPPPAKPFSVTGARIAANGLVTFTALLPSAGRLAARETVQNPTRIASIRTLAPGPGHVVFGSLALVSGRAGSLAVKVPPAAGTARIGRLRRTRAVAIALTVTYTPAGKGAVAVRRTIALRLPRR